ncbi:hypothetical protein GJ496_011137 [Pomphorhynchus laevis]|nr:hypothetical protein GJ496_011137 [Pomphorhynchus laevis]
MALFNKIFKRKIEFKSENKTPYNSNFNPKSNQIVPNNCIDRIRLIVCVEKQSEERKLIFDSKTIEKKIVENVLANNFTSTECSPDSTSDASIQEDGSLSKVLNPPLHLKLSLTKRVPADFSLLSEMIFGNTPLQERNSTLKIHTFNDPVRVMLSKIFFTFNSMRMPSGLQKQRNSVISLVDRVDDTSGKHASSAVLRHDDIMHPSSPSSLNSDSSKQSNVSLPISIDSSNYSSHNISSRYIRWLATQQSQLTESSYTNTSSKSSKAKIKYPITIGFAVIIPLLGDDASEDRVKRFHDFFFAHSPFIEAMVDELAFGMENNILHKSRRSLIYFVKMNEDINRRITNLFCSPRLAHPAWFSLTSLSLTCDSAVYSKRMQQYVDVMREVIQIFNKPSLFLNCLLTAVLRYHINWINTVSPSKQKTKRSMLFKHRAEWASTSKGKASYSPYGTQLMELLGSIATNQGVNRQSRTVILGKNEEIVIKLLYVISYYIRSSTIIANKIKPFDLLETCEQSRKNIDHMYRKPFDIGEFKDQTLSQTDSQLNQQKLFQEVVDYHHLKFSHQSMPYNDKVIPLIPSQLNLQSLISDASCFSKDIYKKSNDQSDLNIIQQHDKESSEPNFIDTISGNLNTITVENTRAVYVPLINLEVTKGVSPSGERYFHLLSGVDGCVELLDNFNSNAGFTNCNRNGASGVDKDGDVHKYNDNNRLITDQQLSANCATTTDSKRTNFYLSDANERSIQSSQQRSSYMGEGGNAHSNHHYSSCSNLKTGLQNASSSSQLFTSYMSINSSNNSKAQYDYNAASNSTITGDSSSNAHECGSNDCNNNSSVHYCQTHMIDLALSLFGGFSNDFIPDLVLQGCCDFNVHSYLKKYIFPKQWLAAEAQMRAKQLTRTPTILSRTHGSQYFWSSPSPPRKFDLEKIKSQNSNILISKTTRPHLSSISSCATNRLLRSEKNSDECCHSSNEHENQHAVSSTIDNKSDICCILSKNHHSASANVQETVSPSEVLNPLSTSVGTDVEHHETSSVEVSPTRYFNNEYSSVYDCNMASSHSPIEHNQHQNYKINNHNHISSSVLRDVESVSHHMNNLRTIYKNQQQDTHDECSTLRQSLITVDANDAGGDAYYSGGSTESLFIIADVESETVSVCSSKHDELQSVKPSNRVKELIKVMQCLCHASLHPEFCLHTIEDHLQKIYLAGKSVHDLAVAQDISLKDSIHMLGMNILDLPLYTAVNEVLSFEKDVSTKFLHLYGGSYQQSQMQPQ